ncbi:hypothetical protein Leryth_009877 [Lithospermum erythrorhizon]|nr:hypothetical protein Leryth_009877 [Lithospermum erythrorhizon]
MEDIRFPHHLLTISSASDVTTTTPPPPPPQQLREVSPNSMQCEAGFLIPNEASLLDNGEGGLNAMEYLTNILASKVYDVANETPLEIATKLSHRLGVNMWLKREDLQPVFSFKLRGAYHMMAKLTKEQLDKGVICSSAGNHAQGVALAAKRLGCDAVIAMPVTTPEIKWKSVERLGATVVLVGDAYDEAQAYAKRRGEEEGRTFIPPFDHPDIIIGQGTVGMEIVRQMKDPIHAIFVPVGGGGLIAGIAAYIKRVAPEIKIIGVEPSDANAMALSLHHGQRIALDQVGGFADGVAVKVVGAETFRLCKELIDGIVLVNRDAMCASIKDVFEEKRSILEPAGALALAGAEAYCKFYGLKDVNVVAITSGANMNFDRLRLVTELADIGRQREAVLATFLPEELGSFKRFCELVGPINITEFRYRYNANKDKALVYTEFSLLFIISHLDVYFLNCLILSSACLLVQLGLHGKINLKKWLAGWGKLNFAPLTLQIMTWSKIICVIWPGALMKFLDALSPRWNISLFHYRAEGRTVANVLVGIQVPHTENDEFRVRADTLGYEYKVESTNEAFELLMH